MDITQLYETTLVDRDTNLSFRFVTVPARAFASPHVLREPYSLVQSLELASFQPLPATTLPYVIAAILVEPNVEDAQARLNQMLAVPRGEGLPIAPEVAEFAQYLAFAPVVPFESSPLDLASLVTVLHTGSGVAIGAAAGFVAAGGTPLVLITVPAGMILGGAAAGVARALEEGLRQRFLGIIGRR